MPVVELAVLVGDYSLFTIGNNEKFIPVSQKVQHPDYYFPTPLNNDIGIAGRSESDPFLSLEKYYLLTRCSSSQCSSL